MTTSSNEVINENVEIQEEFQSENSENIEEKETSNGLENFGIDSDVPELFNSENTSSSEEEFSSFEKDENSEESEEDELEIPAFLRRQKN